MGQRELGAHIQMALETGLRRFSRIDDRPCPATAAHVQTSRSVARLAADFLFTLSLRLQTRMGRGMEIAGDGLMARFAAFRSGKLSPRNARRRHERAIGRRGAGNQDYGERSPAAGHPPKLFALTVKPSS